MTGGQVDRYLARIGYNGPVRPDAGTLQGIQERHFLSVPYENLDIMAGVRLSLDEDALYEKVVASHRGGYCFELNQLFRSLLEAIGFEVTSYFARFLLNETAIPKRRHHILRVKTPQGDYVGDVGVGVRVPLRSVRLEEGAQQAQPYGTYRFRRDSFLGWVLQEKHGGDWRDLFSFTEEKQLPVDFLTTSYFCEAAPESVFNKKIMLSLKTPDGRITMDGNLLKRFSGADAAVTPLTPSEVGGALKSIFGIALPEQTLNAVISATTFEEI